MNFLQSILEGNKYNIEVQPNDRIAVADVPNDKRIYIWEYLTPKELNDNFLNPANYRGKMSSVKKSVMTFDNMDSAKKYADLLNKQLGYRKISLLKMYSKSNESLLEAKIVDKD